MTKNVTTFDKQKQPAKKRGKSLKTVLFEVMRKESMLGVAKNASNDVAQSAFVKHVAARAFDANDPASPQILKEFLSKMYPGLKSTLEKVEFSFPVDGTPTEKSLAVIEAISSGALPADVGQVVIGIIKDAVLIEESTDLKLRIDALEKAIESNG